jgi:hypothetical protein
MNSDAYNLIGIQIFHPALLCFDRLFATIPIMVQFCSFTSGQNKSSKVSPGISGSESELWGGWFRLSASMVWRRGRIRQDPESIAILPHCQSVDEAKAGAVIANQRGAR